MPSRAFTEFLRQLNAQGPEKADGFDRRAFDGLAADERPQVARTLVDAVVRGDNTAAEGIVLFDRPHAPDMLAEALSRVPFATGAGASVAGQAWTLTHYPRYQRELVRYLEHPSPPARLTALGYLKRTPPDAAFAPALAAVVAADTSAVHRSIAASILVCWLGLAPDVGAAYRAAGPLMGELTNADPKVRRAALAQLAPAPR